MWWQRTDRRAETGAIARDAWALSTIEFVFDFAGCRGVLSSAHCSIFSHYIIHFRPGADALPFRIHAHSNVHQTNSVAAFRFAAYFFYRISGTSSVMLYVANATYGNGNIQWNRVPRRHSPTWRRCRRHSKRLKLKIGAKHCCSNSRNNSATVQQGIRFSAHIKFMLFIAAKVSPTV